MERQNASAGEEEWWQRDNNQKKKDLVMIWRSRCDSILIRYAYEQFVFKFPYFSSNFHSGNVTKGSELPTNLDDKSSICSRVPKPTRKKNICKKSKLNKKWMIRKSIGAVIFANCLNETGNCSSIEVIERLYP